MEAVVPICQAEQVGKHQMCAAHMMLICGSFSQSNAYAAEIRRWVLARLCPGGILVCCGQLAPRKSVRFRILVGAGQLDLQTNKSGWSDVYQYASYQSIHT